MEARKSEKEQTKTRKGRCVIVGAGDFFGFPFSLSPDDYLIAADAGYELLKAQGVKPALIVGDFDSMQVAGIRGTTGAVSGLDIFSDAEKADYLSHLKHFSIDGIKARAIDPVKNDPDLLACVRIGIAAGFQEFHLLGATGKRMDHSIANLQILAFLAERDLCGYLYGNGQIITAIKDSAVRFSEKQTGYLSVFALSGEAKGVTERGLKYILNDACLKNSLPTGLSNEFVGETAEVSVQEGTLLLVYENCLPDADASAIISIQRYRAGMCDTIHH